MATVAQTLRLDSELVTRLAARAPQWVAGLLVVLIGVRLAPLLIQLTVPPAADASISVAVAPQPIRNVVDIPSILRANLFGQADPPPTSEAPATSLPLVLSGTMAHADEKRGFAMLGNSSADTKVYGVGETVPGGARLHAVQVDRVLLDRGGSIESLALPPRATVSMAPPPPMPVVAPNPAMSVGAVQDIIRSNPAILGQVIQRQAVLGGDGRLQGVRVNPGSNPQAFNRLGLRPGDLVTAINGLPLVDQASTTQVFENLSNDAQARVTVMRNGTQHELVLNLAEIAQEAEKLAEAPPPDQLPAPESAR